MKLSIAKEHLSFFYKNNYIEFESLISQKDLDLLKEEIPSIIALRLNAQKTDLCSASQSRLYTSSFDIWRGSKKLKKIFLRPHLGEIAATLVKRKKVRMGFDQVFYKTPCLKKESSFFMGEHSLASFACVQGLVCGLLLHIDGTLPDLPHPPLDRNVIPSPHKGGNGVFFLQNAPLSLAHLRASSNGALQILIAYAGETAIYRYSKEHMNTHAYKKLGYVFGDRLQRNTHPFIYES